MAKLQNCTIDSISAHVADLRARIDSAQKEAAALKEEQKGASKRKVLALTRRLESILGPLKKIREQEARANKKLTSLTILQETAKAKIGLEKMSRDEYLSLNSEDRLQHTLQTMEKEQNPGTRLKLLRLFTRTIENSRDLYPSSTRAANLASNANLARRAVQKWAAANSFRYEYDLSSNTHKFFDLLSGVGDGVRHISASTFEEAAIKLDHLYQTRLLSGSFDPPGAVGITTPGPASPRLAPLGRLRTDGSRVDLSGDAKDIVPPSPERSPRSFASFGKIEGLWHQHISSTSAFLSKLHQEGRKLFGSDWNSNFFSAHYQATKATEEAHLISNKFLRSAYDIARKNGLSFDRETGTRLNPAAAWIDSQAEVIWKESKLAGLTPESRREAIRRSLPTIDAEAVEKFSLSPNELKFLREMRGWWDSIGDFLEISDDERRVAYLTRAQRYLETFTHGGDPLKSDATMASFFGTKVRRRIEPDKLTDPTLRDIYKSAEDFDAQEALQMATTSNYFDKVVMYTRSGVRRKVAGEAIDSFIRSVGYTSDETNALTESINGMAIGNMQLSAWAADRVKLEINRLLGRPSDSELKATSRRRDALKKSSDRKRAFAGELSKLSDKLGSNPLIDYGVKALKGWADRNLVTASEPQIRGWLDIYSRLYRAKTFGFNVMAPVRDFTSLAFLAGVRFRQRDVAEVGSKLFFNPKEFMKEFRRQSELGWVRSLDDVIQATEIGRQKQVSPSISQIASDFRAGKLPDLDLDGWTDFAQLAYRSSEIAQHVLVNRLSEVATEKAFDRYSRSKRTPIDLDRFLLDTGVAYSTSAWSDLTKLEVENALLSGNKRSLVEAIQRVNRIETNTLFHRWNSSPYVETGLGRAFMQFGSWSMGLISSMSHTITGPWRNLQTPEMKRLASASVAARWAIGAEALYSLGAAFDIDTSDWIPFFHNALFFGGPAVNMTEDIRALFAGDPTMMQRWEKNPSGVALTLARQALPIIPTSLQRQLGQFYGAGRPGTFYQDFVAPAPRLREVHHRWSFALGFHPFTETPYPTFRRSGISSIALQDTIGVVQDWLAKISSGALPPASPAKTRAFDPLLAP